MVIQKHQPQNLFQPKEFETFAFEDFLELIDRHTRQGGSFENVVHRPERVDRLLRRDNRKVGPEEHFVKDIPFSDGPERVVVGPGTVKIGGNVGIDIWVLADDDAAIDLPRMPEVSEDHLEIGKGGGDTIDVARVSEIEISELNRRRTLMKENRQLQFL